MTGQPAPNEEPAGLLGALFALVRSEFRTGLIVPDPDDPVLGGGTCAVLGCARLRSTRNLCRGHHARWVRVGRPDVAGFAAVTPPLRGAQVRRDEVYDWQRLAAGLRLELGYVLQCRHDERGAHLPPIAFGQLVRVLADADATSLLDHDREAWVALINGHGWAQTGSVTGLLRSAWVRIDDLASGADSEAEYAQDRWDARRLGLPMRAGQGHYSVRFDGIVQPWLRTAVKRWARYELARGHAFPSVRNQINALRWFAGFLADRVPNSADASVLTRPLLEDYLSVLAGSTLVAHTRLRYLIYLQAFLTQARRFDWLPTLPATAALYPDDLPRPDRPLPRFLPEPVMTALESEAALAQLPDPTTRHLVVLLMETGLRAADACGLPFDPIVTDSVGSPCLRYLNGKVRTEQLVPISATAAEAIRAQQQHLRDRWPTTVPWLFPRPHANPDGARPFVYGTLQRRLTRWAALDGLPDEAGQPLRLTAHRFRHTLGTRMINSGVPQPVVQKLLGHASPAMTAVYAHLLDSTVREAFDAYSQTRVDITGRRLGFDPEAPTADAELVKHNLARVQASLPNGYCGRPPQQDCPQPNACLTCPDFQTTPEFLSVHRDQAARNLILIATADADGQFRLAANHRKVQDSLERIIPALQALTPPSDEEPDDAR